MGVVRRQAVRGFPRRRAVCRRYVAICFVRELFEGSL